MADDAFVASAEGYLDHIETILQQFMDYAGSGEKEQPQPGDVNALVSQLAADFAGLGHEFELSLAELPPVPYRPVSLMRLLMNLMQNAVVYGKSGFSVRTWRDAACAYVAVFLALSAFTSRALAIGLAYVLLWEGVLAGLFEGTRTFSIRQATIGLATELQRIISGVTPADAPGNTTTAALVLAAAIVGGLALATWRLSRFQLSGSD